jgi:hypothetical protein
LLARPPNGAVFVHDVAALANERTNPSRSLSNTFRYIEISDVDADSGLVKPKDVLRVDAPGRARKVVHAGDVLVSTVRPDRRTVVVVPNEAEGAICSTGLAVLRPQEIQSHVLAHLLRSPFATAQILRNNVGIAYPAIDESCLLDVLLPATIGKLGAAEPVASELKETESKWKAARASFDDTMAAVEADFLRTRRGASPCPPASGAPRNPALWQRWLETGQPISPVFARNAATTRQLDPGPPRKDVSQFEDAIVTTRQQTAVPPSHVWAFALDSSRTLYCGAAHTFSTFEMPNGDKLLQDEQRAFGPLLPAGAYRTVTTDVEIEECILDHGPSLRTARYELVGDYFQDVGERGVR